MRMRAHEVVLLLLVMVLPLAVNRRLPLLLYCRAADAVVVDSRALRLISQNFRTPRSPTERLNDTRILSCVGEGFGNSMAQSAC